MEKYVNLGGGIFLGGAKKRREEKKGNKYKYMEEGKTKCTVQRVGSTET